MEFRVTEHSHSSPNETTIPTNRSAVTPRPDRSSGRQRPEQSLCGSEMIRREIPLLLGLASHGCERPLDDQLRCGVISQNNSRWETAYWSGSEMTPADERAIHQTAAEALDSHDVVVVGEFSAVGIDLLDSFPSNEPKSGQTDEAMAGPSPHHSSPHSVWAPTSDSPVMPNTPNHALVVSINGRPAPTAMVRMLSLILGRFLWLHSDRHDDKRRLWQTTTILRAAAAWQTLVDDQTLLDSIAQCACEVLECERATIFLWEKSRHKLVGRPAIGVEGGVLEVQDDAGIVGEVLQTGSPKWWSSGGIDDGRVNRRIDRSQNFQTRSLLAVPMFNARDQVIGVFEAINARDADQRGATFDAADVPTLSELAAHAAAAIATQQDRKSLTRTRDRLVSQAATSNPLIGNQHAMRELRANATKVAPTDLSVLILGQNGTGKEVLAQHIHYQSERRNGPFVAVNCAALVETLLESELFGHEKGAFTDASGTRQGKFELANGGTLFLDEVGDMSPGGQAKLLRVLEQRVVVRVGGSQSIPVDVRIIAATNQPLQELIAAKRFREDLFFRLNVVSLTLPPLAKRGDDILLLSDHFIQHFCEKIGRPPLRFDASARAAILHHPWPGNVRELRNTIERICYLISTDVVGQSDLMLQRSAAAVRSDESSSGEKSTNPMNALETKLDEATKDFQVEHIERVIAQCDGNMTEAARRLDVHRSNLYRKMRQLGMPTSEPKTEF